MKPLVPPNIILPVSASEIVLKHPFNIVERQPVVLFIAPPPITLKLAHASKPVTFPVPPIMVLKQLGAFKTPVELGVHELLLIVLETPLRIEDPIPYAVLQTPLPINPILELKKPFPMKEGLNGLESRLEEVAPVAPPTPV